MVNEVQPGTITPPGFRVTDHIAARYDIIAKGTALYKSTGLNLDAHEFTCLFDPMLNIKAVEWK
jgi:hypothetical protein